MRLAALPGPVRAVRWALAPRPEPRRAGAAAVRPSCSPCNRSPMDDTRSPSRTGPNTDEATLDACDISVSSADACYRQNRVVTLLLDERAQRRILRLEADSAARLPDQPVALDIIRLYWQQAAQTPRLRTAPAQAGRAGFCGRKRLVRAAVTARDCEVRGGLRSPQKQSVCTGCFPRRKARNASDKAPAFGQVRALEQTEAGASVPTLSRATHRVAAVQALITSAVAHGDVAAAVAHWRVAHHFFELRVERAVCARCLCAGRWG